MFIDPPSNVDPNPAPPRKPQPEPIINNYMDKPGRWNGPNCDLRARRPLTNDCLEALREAARDNGRSLSAAEHSIIVRKYQ
jgi:hypothetical protein